MDVSAIGQCEAYMYLTKCVITISVFHMVMVTVAKTIIAQPCLTHNVVTEETVGTPVVSLSAVTNTCINQKYAYSTCTKIHNPLHLLCSINLCVINRTTSRHPAGPKNPKIQKTAFSV